MLQYPNINPIAFHLGSLKIHWYGLMYLLGFAIAWRLGVYRARITKEWRPEQVRRIMLWCMLGLILGGRIGHILFYDPFFFQRPGFIYKIIDKGMLSFGGLFGVFLAMCFYARANEKSVWQLTDFLAPLSPLGICAVRIGNFINGELWGKVTKLPWGMVFPSGGPYPRQPSQLYECFIEGIVLFIILWFYSAKPRPRFAVSAMFLLFFGIFRFLVEFTRVPDSQLGYIAWGWLTQGQILTLPLIIWGVIGLVYVYAKDERKSGADLLS